MGWMKALGRKKGIAMHRTYASIENQSQLDFDKLGCMAYTGKHTATKELASILSIRNASSFRGW